MWTLQGKQIVHSSGLAIELLAGTFENPMDLSIDGGKELSAAEKAMLIREGINYAAAQPSVESRKPQAEKPKRPILKLKRQ